MSMSARSIGIAVVLALFLSMISGGIVSTSEPYTHETMMYTRASLHISLYSGDAAAVDLIGPTVIAWSEPYYNGIDWLIDAEITLMDLYGDSDALGPMSVRTEPSPISSGQVVLGSPDDFPAESFFDVSMSIIIPGILPGDTLHTADPVNIAATVDAMPPYFDDYEWYTPGPVVLLNGEDVPVGEITYFRERSITYYEPGAHVTVDMSKGSSIAVPDEGILAFSASLNGYPLPWFGEPVPLPITPSAAVFGIREQGDPGPFLEFYTDTDGSGGRLSTTGPVGEGDGWTGYLDISGYPAAGGYYEIEVDFTVPYIGQLRDTVTAYIDPTAPIPDFVAIPSESIAVFEPDSTQEVVFTTFDEDAVSAELLAFELPERTARDLFPVCQYSLYALGDTANWACLPAAAASCLQYWADHGYPELAHEKPADQGGGGGGFSDGSRAASRADEGETPEMDPYQMAEELAEAMGTDTTGTPAPCGVDGIGAYLEDRGQSGWLLRYQRVADAADMASMLEEFTVDGQDVIIIVYDTTATHSDTTGHAMTLGSHSSGSESEPDSIDFMDPKDGMSGEDHTYPVGYNDAGLPTTDGYNLDGDGSATVTGFIEVSPPKASGDRARLVAARGAQAFTPGVWNILDSGPATGGGMPDTLVWNTTGFPSGTYLLEIRTLDAEGNLGRRLRLARVGDRVTDTGEIDTPKIRTGLRSYPNPFNPATNIELTLTVETDVSLSIYDVSGRLVRRLLSNERREPGVYTVVWRGLNDRGIRVASGVYFCELATRNGKERVKILLIE